MNKRIFYTELSYVFGMIALAFVVALLLRRFRRSCDKWIFDRMDFPFIGIRI